MMTKHALSEHAPKADLAIRETIDRVRMATGRNESADPRDVAFLLARVDALELGLGATRDFIAAQSEDVFGYDNEGDPEIGTRSWAVRDYEIWCIDQVLKHGVTLSGRRHADRYEAQFDVGSPEQDELAISFCDEIADGIRRSGAGVDGVRLLEMASALYRAEMDAHRGDVYHDEEKRDALRTLETIRDGLPRLPEGNWVYRPNELDDWGMVRNLDEEGKCIGFVANSRSGRYEDEREGSLSAHRSARTDPFEAVGRHLVNCNPRAIRRVLDLVQHLENEVRRLEALDRQFARVESWIIMNTGYDGNTKATDGGDRLIRHLEALKRRADANGKRMPT